MCCLSVCKHLWDTNYARTCNLSTLPNEKAIINVTPVPKQLLGVARLRNIPLAMGRSGERSELNEDLQIINVLAFREAIHLLGFKIAS